MDFVGALRRGWEIIQLKVETVRQVAEDQNAFLPALVILAIAGALGGIGQLNPLVIVAGAILQPIVMFVVVGIFHLLALVFGGKGGYLPLYNVLGHGNGLLGWVGVVPFVGPFLAFIAGLWGIAIAIVSVREVHRLSTGQAVVVVLIPVVLIIVCCVAATVMFSAALIGMISSQQ
ncbi:MAG: YIP1 family protein [Acidobacteriota bacterium]|nr:MAG: YIP1 family protein [Acidobacteriota bacterium]